MDYALYNPLARIQEDFPDHNFRIDDDNQLYIDNIKTHVVLKGQTEFEKNLAIKSLQEDLEEALYHAIRAAIKDILYPAS